MMAVCGHSGTNTSQHLNRIRWQAFGPLGAPGDKWEISSTHGVHQDLAVSDAFKVLNLLFTTVVIKLSPTVSLLWLQASDCSRA